MEITINKYYIYKKISQQNNQTVVNLNFPAEIKGK